MQNTETKDRAAGTGPRIRPFDFIAAILVSLAVGASVGQIINELRRKDIATEFHQLYYDDYATRNSTTWLGTLVQKLPFDAWIYQEIFFENRPDVLLEMGTLKGGSALYAASIFDLIGNGRVITVDIERQPNLPNHPRITFLNGSSTSQDIVNQIRALIRPGDKVMVTLDSDHHTPHVAEELQIYSQFVTPGQYLVVEDTNIAGHPVRSGWDDGGPFAALDPFLKEHSQFKRDRHRERLKVTFNPGGWLRRVH